MNRGFRYQTGEIKEVAQLMKQNIIPEIDIDKEEELEEIINDLKSYGFFRSQAKEDYNAKDKEKYPDFLYRLEFVNEDNNQKYYLDVYEAPKDSEEGYDEIFWG